MKTPKDRYLARLKTKPKSNKEARKANYLLLRQMNGQKTQFKDIVLKGTNGQALNQQNNQRSSATHKSILQTQKSLPSNDNTTY